jgi:hypothetical protein
MGVTGCGTGFADTHLQRMPSSDALRSAKWMWRTVVDDQGMPQRILGR